MTTTGKWYVAGPDTCFNKLGRAMGGATGMGGRTRVWEGLPAAAPGLSATLRPHG